MYVYACVCIHVFLQDTLGVGMWVRRRGSKILICICIVGPLTFLAPHPHGNEVCCIWRQAISRLVQVVAGVTQAYKIFNDSYL